MVELFANSGDPDQMPHFAASDLNLHFLPITLLGVSRLHWVNSEILLYIMREYGGAHWIDLLYRIYSKSFDRQALANSEDPDEMPQNAASHQGLHCLLLTAIFRHNNR